MPLFSKPRGQVSKSVTVSAPVGGLNVASPISNMPQTDAISMRNFFPEPMGCRVRKGYVEHSTGLTGEVTSIMEYCPSNGATKIFAADSVGIWDITSPMDMTGQTKICLSSNSWWQHTLFSNSAGTHLIAYNGTDDGFIYSPDGLHRLIAGNGTTAWTLSGVDPKSLVVPVVHQHRVWAVEKNTTKAWYLPPEQVWGVAKFFDFGANFSRGGFLQTLAVYTQDSGYGPDDYLAAISSAGEMVLYKGTNPDDSATWGLVGAFYIGETFTRRCTARFGGDVAILSQYGMVTIDSITKPSDVTVLDNALSAKIQYLISELVTDGSSRAGWSILLFPSANMIIINVPGIYPSQTLQLVYNTITKAWSQFQGMAANCWKVAKGSPMFGSSGKVYRAWEGYLDGVSLANTGGTPVAAEAQQAFSYFDTPGQNKHFKMLRPTFVRLGKFRYQAGANMDFDFTAQPPPVGIGEPDPGIWNVSKWDSGVVWVGDPSSAKAWTSIVGLGYAASITISVLAPSETIWVSTDWLYEVGGAV